MNKFYFLIILFASLTSFAQKPPSTSGYLIYILGKDTTMAGLYVLDNNEFEIVVVTRPSVTITRLNGTLFENGELQTAKGTAHRMGAESQADVNYKLYVKGDSTFIEQIRGKEVTVQRFAGRGMTANGIGAPFRYFLPFWGFYVPKKIGDSIKSGHLTLGTNKKLTLKRIATDKIYGGSSVMGNMTLLLDKNGNLKHIDAIGSSWNVIGKVTGPIDLEALAIRFAAEEKQGSGISVIAKADSAYGNFGDASMKIYYSRPQVRGRVIFGSVVPYDRFWRTGANAATRMVITKPIYFGDKELPAGSYSIWTIPSPKGWTIMFNSQATIWGTEYNPDYDVLRVPMQYGKAPNFTEIMTIEIQPLEGGGQLNIIWDNTKATVPFRVKN